MEQQDAILAAPAPGQEVAGATPASVRPPLPPLAAVTPPRPASQAAGQEPTFPPWLLNAGFVVGLLLAIACLAAGGYYLYRFQGVTQDAVLKVLNGRLNEVGLYQVALGAQLYLARVQLVACGIFIGMAFGFLGFALFLLGAKGQVTAEGSGAALALKVLNLAPGAFVLLCATILVGVSVTHPLNFGYGQNGGGIIQGAARPVVRDSTAIIPVPTLPATDSTQDSM